MECSSQDRIMPGTNTMASRVGWLASAVDVSTAVVCVDWGAELPPWAVGAVGAGTPLVGAGDGATLPASSAGALGGLSSVSSAALPGCAIVASPPHGSDGCSTNQDG